VLPYAVDGNFQPQPNVVAIEVPFQDSMPCPGLRNIAIMSDPVNRHISYMLAHADWKEDMILEYIRHKTPRPKKYYMNGYPIVNSKVIRQLLGSQRFIYT
jgi:hypothetical protein